MNKKLLILLVISIVLSGCESDDPGLLREHDVVLVEVDGEPITKAMLEYLMTVRGVAEDDADGMRALFEELIRLQAVANAARREQIADRQEVRAERMLKDIEVLYLRYLEQFQKDNPVTDQDIARVYHEQRQRAGDTRYRLETIEFPDQVAAIAAIEALRSGELDFADAVEQASAEQRLARRTDWVDASQVPPAFLPVLKATAAGQVAPEPMPFESTWLVVRVAEREALTMPPLKEVREGIRRSLIRERSKAMIELLYEQAEITPMLPLESAEVAATETASHSGTP